MAGGSAARGPARADWNAVSTTLWTRGDYAAVYDFAEVNKRQPASPCSAPGGPAPEMPENRAHPCSGPRAPQTSPAPARMVPCAAQSHGLETGPGQQPPSAIKSPAPFCQLRPCWRIWHLLGQQHRGDPGSASQAPAPIPTPTPRHLEPRGVTGSWWAISWMGHGVHMGPVQTFPREQGPPLPCTSGTLLAQFSVSRPCITVNSDTPGDQKCPWQATGGGAIWAMTSPKGCLPPPVGWLEPRASARGKVDVWGGGPML